MCSRSLELFLSYYAFPITCSLALRAWKTHIIFLVPVSFLCIWRYKQSCLWGAWFATLLHILNRSYRRQENALLGCSHQPLCYHQEALCWMCFFTLCTIAPLPQLFFPDNSESWGRAGVGGSLMLSFIHSLILLISNVCAHRFKEELRHRLDPQAAHTIGDNLTYKLWSQCFEPYVHMDNESWKWKPSPDLRDWRLLKQETSEQILLFSWQQEVGEGGW